jgi:peptidylprolyl isomerase
MPIDQGTLVYINFTAKVKDTGEAVETTLEEQAKNLGILDQNRRYEPRLVAIGEGWVLKGLDEEIKTMGVGETKTIELAPEKAWGERDPTLLRMIPLRKFGEKASDLRVGDVVEVDNRMGIVRFIGSGRAQIDFNHRLAGKTLIYDVETIKKLDTDEEKIRALIGRRFPGEGEKLVFAHEDEKVVVDIPEELFLAEGLQIIKRGIGNDIIHFILFLNDFSFRETYTSKGKEEKPKEEKKTD